MKRFLQGNTTDSDAGFFIVRALFNGNVTLPDLLKSDPQTTGTNGKFSIHINGLWAKPQMS